MPSKTLRSGKVVVEPELPYESKLENALIAYDRSKNVSKSAGDNKIARDALQRAIDRRKAGGPVMGKIGRKRFYSETVEEKVSEKAYKAEMELKSLGGSNLSIVKILQDEKKNELKSKGKSALNVVKQPSRSTATRSIQRILPHKSIRGTFKNLLRIKNKQNICNAFSLVCTYTQCVKNVKESRIYNIDDCTAMLGAMGTKPQIRLTKKGKKELKQRNLCPSVEKHQPQQRSVTFCLMNSTAGEHLGTIVKIFDDKFVKVAEIPEEVEPADEDVWVEYEEEDEEVDEVENEKVDEEEKNEFEEALFDEPLSSSSSSNSRVLRSSPSANQPSTRLSVISPPLVSNSKKARTSSSEIASSSSSSSSSSSKGTTSLPETNDIESDTDISTGLNMTGSKVRRYIVSLVAILFYTDMIFMFILITCLSFV
jgi:hypothetical protein